jgi:phytoene dehydrogenase-like protein
VSKSIIIIGSGVAGLSAGSYGQMNGFRTQIFEMHDRAGGLCTSWKRKGYDIDGCVHGLLGSSPANPFYRMWSELLDMSRVEFHNAETEDVIEFPLRTLKLLTILSGTPGTSRNLPFPSTLPASLI